MELTDKWLAIGLLISCVIIATMLLSFGLGKEVGKDEVNKHGRHRKSHET